MDYGIGGVHPGVFLVVTTDHPRLRRLQEAWMKGRMAEDTLVSLMDAMAIESQLS